MLSAQRRSSAKLPQNCCGKGEIRLLSSATPISRHCFSGILNVIRAYFIAAGGAFLGVLADFRELGDEFLNLLNGLRSRMLVNISKQNITRSAKWLRVL